MQRKSNRIFSSKIPVQCGFVREHRRFQGVDYGDLEVVISGAYRLEMLHFEFYYIYDYNIQQSSRQIVQSNIKVNVIA